MEVSRPEGDATISFTQFLSRLTKRVGAISKDQHRALKEMFGADIEVKKADEVIRQIEDEGRFNAQTAGACDVANK